MSGGPRIIPIESGQPVSGALDDILELREAYAEPVLELREVADEPFEAALPLSPAWVVDEVDASPDDSRRRNLGWIAPAAALLAITGWTTFFAWSVWPEILAGPTPAVVGYWISSWSTPVALIALTWLLAIRSSKREGARFADVARGLSEESARLEQRLVSVNNELSLARDFVASQSRDLESLGRVAVDRLSGSAARLQELISGNGQRLDQIGTVSVNALENMEKLRGQLPVIANAAKDVANNIGNAGRTAHIQIEDMVSGFQRLNDFGLASERQVMLIREKVDGAVAEFERQAEQLGTIATARFAALGSEGDAHRQRLDQEEIAVLASIRARSEALDRELSEHREAAMATESATLEALNARFAALRGALKALGGDHEMTVEVASARLSAFEESARALSNGLSDHARKVDDELARRRATTEAAAAEQRGTLARELAEIDQAISERRAAMASAGAEAADALARKLAELDHVVEEQHQRQLESATTLANHCDAIATRVSAFTDTLRASGEQGSNTADAVDRALATLNSRLTDSREALAGTDGRIAELTDASVRLLELIRASADHTRTDIPEAIRSGEAGLKGIEDRVFLLRDTLREAGDSGRSVSDYIVSTRKEVAGAMDDVGHLHQDFLQRAAAQEQQLTAMQAALAAARAESDGLTRDIEQHLDGAIARLTAAASKAGEDLRGKTADEISAIAEQLGEHSSAAIARVLQGRGAELVARLEEAIDTASEASRDVAVQMRDQLAKVDELAGNLETRVTRARERAEEHVDNDFARRAALITESLNSTSIDIAKALSTDVSETAWSSYLRGDRGIFTRRAVSLLENAEAKSVQQHYEGDSEFREHVNRYIHDFESMLRQLLSTRDGNALGVTLLSSDMGKLYVVLAQGIERLRA